MKYNYNYLLEHQDKVLKTMPNNNSLPVIEYQIKNNLNKKYLNYFFSPIRLDLNAKTPEQIALSIISEIVMLEKNGTGMQKRDIIKKND